MTRIKICGITNVNDAQMAAREGADALGFIAVKSSPRFVPPSEYFWIKTVLPPFVVRVVVAQMHDDAEAYTPDSVQYYADPTDGTRRIPGEISVIRAFRMRDASSLQEIRDFAEPADALLLDAYHPNTLGGSGETFNWTLARDAKALTDKPIILAGGLTPDNVQDALTAVAPYGVDVSSGVELSPGIKDPAKVRAFIRAVREWDLRHA